jgi:hypothetical protein
LAKVEKYQRLAREWLRMAERADPEAARESAKSAVPRRGESTGVMEPVLVSQSSGSRIPLADLTVELAARSASFMHSLPNAAR